MGIHLVDQTLVQQIEEIAEQENHSPEQVIKNALQVYASQSKELPKPKTSSFLLSIAGLGKSGQHDTASRAEEILATEIDPHSGWSLHQDARDSG
jgi:hypothetical protein